MPIFTRVDHAIIDYVYQPTANALSWRASPKELSLFCLMGDIVGTLASMYVAYISNKTYTEYAISAILLPLIYLSMASKPDTTSRLGNPVRIRPISIMIRLTCVVAFVCNIASFMFSATLKTAISNCSFFLYACALYFEACNTPPPREKRKPVGNYAWSRS